MDKIGAKPGIRAILIDAPDDIAKEIATTELDLKMKLTGEFDYIHIFVVTQLMMKEKFPNLKSHLKPTGSMWISWPKSKQLETDLTLPKVIEIGYDFGLVESKTISIDEVWSAIKFTFPKKGKEYHNSYGNLK